MSNKTVAIIVTYNRSELLARCISYINNQSIRPDKIVVINNGSTDNTLNMLTEMGIKTITQKNLGSAGGWKRGLQYALENNYHSAWLMDDDGYPDKSSLELLKNSLKKDKSCVSSVVIQENSSDIFVFPLPILNKNDLPCLISFPRKLRTINEFKKRFKGIEYPFAHLFNGALISIEAVKKIGNIDDRYYLYGEEVDYFFRLRTVGKVISRTDAFHFHPDVTKRGYSMVKIYYAIKNSIILNKSYFDYKLFRNIASIMIVLLRVANRNGLKAFLSLIIGANKKIFYLAIIRGLKGNIGMDHE